jgi:hypothetical protein
MTSGIRLTIKEMKARANKPRPKNTQSKEYQQRWRARVALGMETRETHLCQADLIAQRKAIVSQQAK